MFLNVACSSDDRGLILKHLMVMSQAGQSSLDKLVMRPVSVQQQVCSTYGRSAAPRAGLQHLEQVCRVEAGATASVVPDTGCSEAHKAQSAKHNSQSWL